MNKKIIIISGILILALGAGAIYSLPYVTIYRIIAALETKDTQQLSVLVDFPQIRENLKRLVGTKIQAGTADAKTDAWGQIQKSAASQVIAGALEELVTPEGLVNFAQQRLEAVAAAQDGPNKIKPTAWLLFVTLIGNADLAYASPSEFTVAVKVSDTGRIRFILRRNGVAWRLTNIEF
ncbi:MAG: DUF2939 domain-containing protein [Deltaproteobacteria bacterium]|nr:DUF2939 domain-containing protein [Deltaproteobacteria bacterium]